MLGQESEAYRVVLLKTSLDVFADHHFKAACSRGGAEISSISSFSCSADIRAVDETLTGLTRTIPQTLVSVACRVRATFSLT